MIGRIFVLGTILALVSLPAMMRGVVRVESAGAGPAMITTSDRPDFGPNVYIFDPSMPTSQIQASVNAIANQQVSNEFGTQRYALLFEPGTYGSASNPLNFQVGYYTDVAGLGASPSDVVINGSVDVYNQCSGVCTALVNHWRSLSNLTIHFVSGGSTCQGTAEFWAVSQAAPIRRVHVEGFITLFDYCSPGFASGGFIADSQFSGSTVLNGSQQQWLVRNSDLDGWTNGVWNQVFSGVIGAPPQSFSTTPLNPPPYTTLAASPVTEEKPYLTIDQNGTYSVFVPAMQTNASGTTWANGPTAGTSIPLSNFYVAKPTDTASTINEALQRGLNLIVTPGIYHVNQTIEVTHPHTVVYGMGLATIVPDNGVIPMRVADVNGVKISGLLFDAGPINSPVLLQVGSGSPAARHVRDPTVLQDVFFRIGGAGVGKATTSLVVNNNDTILDDIWAWRADHGTGVGWTVNTADTGLVVNGNHVTAYGLFVEHYQKYEVIWNGNNGTDIFFQNEMPYDPPNQAAWINGSMNGYAAFKVADTVTAFQGWGMGSYCFFNVNPTVNAYHAFEVPVTPEVQFHDLLTVSLGGVGTITHVVNDTGATAQGTSTIPVNIVSYP
jgi:hypothetical protein